MRKVKFRQFMAFHINNDTLHWRHNDHDGVSNHQPHGVYSTVYSDADESRHQSSASLAFVRGIHRSRWIPRTKGQLRGKCFHLMTSSWFHHYTITCTTVLIINMISIGVCMICLHVFHMLFRLSVFVVMHDDVYSKLHIYLVKLGSSFCLLGNFVLW